MQDGMMKEGGSCGSGGCGCGKGGCGCLHHKLPVLMVLLLGLLFLGRAMGWVGPNMVDVAWPVLVIVGALTKLTGGKCKCC